MLEYLHTLELKTGWTLTRIAKEASLQHTTLTRFTNSQDHKFMLSSLTLEKLRKRFGFGPGEDPPAFDGLMHPTTSAGAREPRASFSSILDSMPRDIPVRNVSAEAEFALPDGGHAEALVFEPAATIRMVTRPAALEGVRGIYAFYVPGTAMSPRFRVGELIMVDPNRQPRIGDDVVVIIGEHEGRRSALLKTLAGADAEGLRLEQYSPPLQFGLPASRILALHRVVALEELLHG